jgi:hypothetical protein
MTVSKSFSVTCQGLDFKIFHVCGVEWDKTSSADL